MLQACNEIGGSCAVLVKVLTDAFSRASDNIGACVQHRKNGRHLLSLIAFSFVGPSVLDDGGSPTGAASDTTSFTSCDVVRISGTLWCSSRTGSVCRRKSEASFKLPFRTRTSHHGLRRGWVVRVLEHGHGSLRLKQPEVASSARLGCSRARRAPVPTMPRLLHRRYPKPWERKGGRQSNNQQSHGRCDPRQVT